MKKLLFALAMFGLALSAGPRTTGAEISIDYFYDNLSGGNWIDVEGYGYCWQPDVAVSDSTWRPYTDGYWAYTDAGWTWIAYEDFGWATYHYGRWARLSDYGWIWVPGADLEWGPAWVSWRTGGDYIGWAPLPPRGPEIVYESQPIGAQVDIEFDIGPEYYNFCDVRYIGEPVLRHRIVDYRQNVTYINQTVNVTNITVQNNIVYNYGPDINYINQRSSRPIQRLHLERQENVDLAAAAKTGAVTKVQGNNLIVAAPMKLAKPNKQIAPPKVKTKVAQAKIDTGWAGVDSTTQNQIKEKVKNEDHTKIPPPIAAGAATQAGANFSAPPGASRTPPAGFEGGKGKDGKRGQAVERAAGASASPGASPGPVNPGEGGRHKGRPGEQPATNLPATGASVAPEATTVPGGKHGRKFEPSNVGPSPSSSVGQENVDRGGGKHERGQFQPGNVGATPSASVGQNLGEGPGRHKKFEEGPTSTGQGNIQGENVNPPGGKKHRIEEVPTSPSGAAGAQPLGGPNPEGPRGGKHNVENVNAPSGGATGSGSAAEEKHERKQKGEKGASPSPPSQ